MSADQHHPAAPERYMGGDLAGATRFPEFPRSAQYQPEWMLENLMGPNAVWLTEALCERLDLRPGMRVLDMGCGKAMSAIFLAREFGVQVWATDLWIAASDNWARIREAGLTDRVFPIHAEAHALPFADGFFDAAVSADAYHYFGTDNLYLSYYARFVRPGGQLGIVVPGLREEFADGVPPHLAPYWEPDFWSFHSPAWWRAHWERAGLVEVAVADMVPHGWEHWLRWLEVATAHGYPSSERETEMVRIDAGRTLGFTRLIARKVEG
jgi:cyclopropane fatty-acyl-phospholipid synthase-like methyltransferase